MHSYVVCGITRTTDTCSECVILLFHCNTGYTNALQCYVICELPVFVLAPSTSAIVEILQPKKSVSSGNLYLCFPYNSI